MDMVTKTHMETVMQTDMETDMDIETEMKLYLIRRSSSYRALRIVTNMSTAQFPMALCTCSAYLLGKDGHKNFTAIVTSL
jgi:hypothetical protein